MSDYFHHRGGTLSPDHPTYIERQADTDLFYALMGGEFCYVLNASQMGKSSLCNRIAGQLVAEGAICAFFDLKELDEIQDPREWYSMLIEELSRKFKVSDLLDGWISNKDSLPPNILLKKFCTEILLKHLQQKRIVIFFDEIGTLLSKEFKKYFLIFIKIWHDTRAQDSDFNRLVFCLLGIVAPSDLVTDPQYNFNIGQDIKLAGLEFDNTVKSFSPGLKGKVDNPSKTIKEIFDWTNGQPFLTQTLCHIVGEHAKNGKIDVDGFVKSELIPSWGYRNDLFGQHFQHIPKYLFARNRGSDPVKLLMILDKIIDNENISYNSQCPEHIQLKLSGIIKIEPNGIKIFNKLYATIFNKEWIHQELFDMPKTWLSEEITYSEPPSLITQKILKLLDTKLYLVVLAVIIIDLISLYSSYYLFASPAWNEKFNKFGTGLYIELTRSLFVTVFAYYSYKDLFYQEFRNILTLERLWWVRISLKTIGCLFVVMILFYHLILGPMNLEHKALFNASSSPYFWLIPYAVINFVAIGISMASVTIYSAILDSSKSYKMIKNINYSVAKVNDFIQKYALSMQDKEDFNQEITSAFEELFYTFINYFIRYFLLSLGIFNLLIFELAVGRKTLAEGAQALTILEYLFCFIGVVMMLLAGAREYKKIFKESRKLLILQNINILDDSLKQYSLERLIFRGLSNVKNRKYMGIFVLLIGMLILTIIL